MKAYFTYRWRFDGPAFWAEAFRPLATDDYAALLGAKGIGTRNPSLAVVIAACLALKQRRYVAICLLMGAVVETFDGFWLAVGKASGWSTGMGDSYMVGAFVWVPILVVSGWVGLRPLPSEEPNSSSR